MGKRDKILRCAQSSGNQYRVKDLQMNASGSLWGQAELLGFYSETR